MPLIVLFVIALLLLPGAKVFAGYHDRPESPLISLEGEHRFRGGDNPAWSSPFFDDSSWHTIRAPGIWQSQGVDQEKSIGWYRIRFLAPEALKGVRPALYLGRIGDADEVFINGVKIGGEGVIGDGMVEAAKIERLYTIPPTLIRYDRENLLAIRVMQIYEGGLLSEGIGIGNYSDLLLLKMERVLPIRIVETAYFTFFALVMVICAFLFVSGLREKGFLAFVALVVLFIITYVLGSVTLYEAGVTSHVLERISLVALASIPTCLLLMVIFSCNYPLSRPLWGILLSGPLLSVGFLLSSRFRTLYILYDLWALCATASAGVSVTICFKTFKKPNREVSFAIAGVTGMFAGVLVEALEYLGFIHLGEFWGERILLLAAPLTILPILYGVSSRFLRMKEGIRNLSGRILMANEEERKRLARDLHDGIGQSLLAIKLGLQMTAGKTGENCEIKRDVERLIGAVSDTLDEVKQFAMELRPSFFEKMEIGEILVWYGRNIQEKTGVSVVVDAAGFSGEIAQRPKENLYRICQEAVGNALKHSGAARIDIGLKESSQTLVLHVCDNGKGLTPRLPGSRKPRGLGLETMRERAELLGGVFTVTSVPDQGTTVTVEVPLLGCL
jgi:signal transduction histidine kinase